MEYLSTELLSYLNTSNSTSIQKGTVVKNIKKTIVNHTESLNSVVTLKRKLDIVNDDQIVKYLKLENDLIEITTDLRFMDI